MTAARRLAELGIELPPVNAPLASYVPAVRSGQWVYTSGQLPLADGSLLHTGRVGDEVTTEQAVECARRCGINALAALASVVGLDDLRIVKVVGYVAGADGFDQQHVVMNGCSDLFVEVLAEHGVHARSAVGVAGLPLSAPVEVEVVAEVR